LSWLPDTFILYQLENLATWVAKSPAYLSLASRAVAVWEFSPQQLSLWVERRVVASWVPVFVPLGEGGERGGERAVDVLFYGGWSERREGVRQRLEVRRSRGEGLW
jgi:hypothetical protein